MSFDYYISIGNDCCPALAFDTLNIKQATLPFDWVPSNIDIFYDFLLHPRRFCSLGLDSSLKNEELLDFSQYDHIMYTGRMNSYGVWFPHDIAKSDEDLIEQLKRRTQRFFSVLCTSQKVLFMYTNEHALYLQCFRDNQDKYYHILLDIEEWIASHYPTLDFVIVACHVNKEYDNTERLLNFNVSYPSNLLINDGTLKGKYEHYFRASITKILADHLGIDIPK